MKEVVWLGDSLENLRGFPDEVKDSIGHALRRVQYGLTPRSAKPLTGLSGVYEIKDDHKSDTFRTVYIAKLKNAVYVLHCFQKKSKSGVKTPPKDMELIKRRLKAALDYDAS